MAEYYRQYESIQGRFSTSAVKIRRIQTPMSKRMFYLFTIQGFHISLNVALSFMDSLLDV